MRIVLTDSFLKLAASWDDQPGFVNRDVAPGILPGNKNRATEGKKEIIERWMKRNKRKHRKNKQIYQLGLEIPTTTKDEILPLLTL